MIMKHKVVHYIESRGFGGAEISVLNLLRGLDLNKWDPILIYHSNPDISKFIEKVKELNLETICFPQIKNWRDITGMISFIKKLRKIHPSVFHAHLTWNLRCSFGILCAYFSGINTVVATQHLYQEVRSRRLYKLYILQIYQKFISIFVDRYIAVSYGQAEQLKRAVISRDKVQVVQNGIYVEDYSKKSQNNLLRSPLSKNGGELWVVLTVARLDKQKGHIYLLNASSLIPRAVFFLAGDGPERANLEERVKQMNLYDKVIFLGHREDIAELMHNCDLFVLPSLFEGLPLSILEAMSACKPVIATDIEGINEIIIHGKTGLLVPSADSNALAENINLLISNPSLANKIAVAGRERIIQEFSAQKMVEGVTKIYEEIIRQRSV